MLHEIVEKQANKSPDMVAFVSGDTALTYWQLNDQSARVAKFLAKCYSIKAGDRVATSVSRTSYQMILLLALSKLGATSIFMSKLCPDKRIASILRGSRPALLITDESSFAAEHIEHQRRVILDHKAQEEILTYEMDEDLINLPKEQSQRDDLFAYIVYTSGTTGEPKGVPIKHAGLHYWEKIIAENTDISSGDRVLGFCSAGFDAHVWEYLLAFATGATYYLTDHSTRQDISALVNFMSHNEITHATLIPTKIRQLSGTDLSILQRKLRTIFTTGEACTPDMVQSFEAHKIRLVNCYGPSEATFGISITECNSADIVNDIVPIAKPIGDEIKIKVVDDNFKPVQSGNLGELIFSSPYLTSGYLHSSNIDTSNNFWINPKGRRYFCTGDSVSQHPSKENLLLYHGRKTLSSQAKINGILINPLETESKIREFPYVKDVCVLLNNFEPDNLFLVAFIVLVKQKINKTTTEQRIRKKLRESLINEAIPAVNFYTKKLPETNNGKVDRNKLHLKMKSKLKVMLNDNRLISSIKNETLRKVFKIFQETLPVCSSLDQDFESLGGNSIRFSGLLSRITKEFNINIPLQAFGDFNELTAKKCYGLVQERLLMAKAKVLITPLDEHFQSKNTINLFLFPPITGEANKTYQQLANYLQKETKDVCIYMINLKLKKFLQEEIEEKHMDLVIKQIAKSILKIQSDKPFYFLGWSDGGTKAWRVAELLESQGKTISYLGLIDAIAPPYYHKLTPQAFKKELTLLVNNLIDLFDKNFNENLRSSAKDICNVSTEKMQKLSHADLVKKIFKLFLSKAKGVDIKYYIKLAELTILYNLSNNCQQLNVKPRIYPLRKTVKRIKNSGAGLTIEAGLGWYEHANQCVLYRLLPGEHFSVVNDPETIKAAIDAIIPDLTQRLKNSNDSSGIRELLQTEFGKIQTMLFHNLPRRNSSPPPYQITDMDKLHLEPKNELKARSLDNF